MKTHRLSNVLYPFSDLRSNERLAARYFFLFFFFMTFSVYIVKTVRETLLIADVKPVWWPLVDLVTAVFIGFIVVLSTRLFNRLTRRTYMTFAFIFFMTNLFLFWLIFDFKTRALVQTPILLSSGFFWMAPFWTSIQFSTISLPVILFCLWTDIFIATSITHYWIAVNDVFHPYQAKRIVGPIVTGGLLGGIGGALLSSLLAGPIGTDNLLLLDLGFCFVTLILANLVYAKGKKVGKFQDFLSPQIPHKGGFCRGLMIILTNRYLKILSALLATAIVVATLVNYQFKIVIRVWKPEKDERTVILGVFFFVLLLLSYLLHRFATDRILKNRSIRTALLFAPLAVLLISFSFFLIPVSIFVGWALFLRGSDKILDSTLSQSVRELLYIPVPDDVKYRAKLFIDMFVKKFASGFGAILFLALYAFFHFREVFDFLPEAAERDIPELLSQSRGPIQLVGIPIIILSLLWIVLVCFVYREYRRTIEPAPDTAPSPPIDIAKIRMIIDLIESKERSSALYAMILFDLMEKGQLTSELRKDLSDEAKARVLDSHIDVGGEGFFAGIEDPLAEEEFRKVIKEVLASDDYISLIEKQLMKDAQSEKEMLRLEAAKLIGFLKPKPGIMRILGELLQDPSPDVRYIALSSASIYKRQEHVSVIIDQLEFPPTRDAAQDALAEYGATIVNVLEKYLEDKKGNLLIRRALPSVLARIGTQRTADILLSKLARGEGEIEQELIEALKHVRTTRPEVCFEVRNVRSAIFSLLTRSYQHYLSVVPSGHVLESASDQEAPPRIHLEIKLVFDLLSLLYAWEKIYAVYGKILEGSSGSIDNALNILDNLLLKDKSLKTFLFPLIENMTLEERLDCLERLAEKLEKIKHK